MRFLFDINDADPIISQHAVEWLVCIESYQSPRRVRIRDWSLTYEAMETCIYTNQKTSIIGFRGTHTTKDLYDDAKITLGQVFPRSIEAIELIKGMLKRTPDHRFVVTGHSLGGAIAKAVGDKLTLETVTFNQAAPPTFPVLNSPLSTNYHISFDIISAWQSNNVTRICKGFWPIASTWERFIPYIWLYHMLNGVIPSHALKNFAKPSGQIITAREETLRIRKWFSSLPSNGKIFVLFSIFGINQSINMTAPEIPE